MFKLPTIGEVCGATKYCYVTSGGFDGVTLLLKDGRAFTAWEDGEVEVPGQCNTPCYGEDGEVDIENAIKAFVSYAKLA